MHQVFRSAAKNLGFGILAGVLDCLAHFLVAYVIGLPLFMDTMFALTVTFLIGPWCGIISAVFTNLITLILLYMPGLIQDRGLLIYFLYVLCAASGVVLTHYFNRKYIIPGVAEDGSLLNKITLLLLLSVIMCVVMSITGGLISGFINIILSNKSVKSVSPDVYFKMGLLLNNVPALLSEILSRIPINIVDRIVSVFGAYELAALGKRLWKKF